MKSHETTHSPTSRWMGLSIIVFAVTFSAGILLLEKNKIEQNANNSISRNNKSSIADITLPGFSEQFWFLPDDNWLGFVEIPAGEFLMGSDPAVDRQAYENERWSNRLRRGRVTLPSYFIGRYEVTIAQFRVFVEDTNRTVDENTLSGAPDHPVTHITLTDALAYCRWLQEKMRTQQNLPMELADLLSKGWTITLPSEAQWEKAARGPSGAIYPWGNQPTTTFANYRAQSINKVGSKDCPNCVYGLADMSGNVWEITRSYYLPYPYDEAAHPDLESDALFVMRGGSFADAENNVRAAVRGGVDPGVRNPAIGFRLVLSPNKNGSN